jgi:hypothetical protein
MEVSDPSLFTHKERALSTHVLRGWIENNIKMILKEIGYEDENLIYLTGDKDQWRAIIIMVMNILVSGKMENFLTS